MRNRFLFKSLYYKSVVVELHGAGEQVSIFFTAQCWQVWGCLHKKNTPNILDKNPELSDSVNNRPQ